MTDRRDPPIDGQLSDVDAESQLAEWFAEEAPLREPQVLVPNVVARTALTKRRSRWFVVDWWRDLFRANQRSSLTLALGGAVGVVAVIALLAIVLVPASPTETLDPVMPADAVVVNAADPDRHQTISAAIAAAEDGDTVAILPGTYTENVVIDKSITLMGAGERDAVVLAPADPEEPILLIDSVDATVSGFTITGSGSSVSVVSGAPIIENMIFKDVGDQWWTWTGTSWDGYDQAKPSIVVELFAEPIIRGNLFDEGGEVKITNGSVAQLLDNDFINGTAIFLADAGDGTIVRGNIITDSGLYSIESSSAAELFIEGNVITQSDPGIGIQLMGGRGTIRDNEIRGVQTGIQIGDDASPLVTGNVIEATGAAFEIHPEISAEIVGNELCGDNVILALMGDAVAPDLTDNTLCDSPMTIE
jgi:nitrous oxidase accessory protein